MAEASHLCSGSKTCTGPTHRAQKHALMLAAATSLLNSNCKHRCTFVMQAHDIPHTTIPAWPSCCTYMQRHCHKHFCMHGNSGGCQWFLCICVKMVNTASCGMVVPTTCQLASENLLDLDAATTNFFVNMHNHSVIIVYKSLP